MMLRTGEDNERTRRNDQIAEGNREREQVLEGLKYERRLLLSMAGGIGC